MAKELLMGNEAMALGAIRAGVRVVTGYPGTPSTEVLETVAAQKRPGIYVEWSVNEKAALEVAAGAAIAGARALVTMKQVGLNVASDPLMSLNYVGVSGGLVVVVADDPGPISSQTEQDTRHFAKYAKLAVFDPASPEEAYQMMADAFALSEGIGRPVLLRPTTRICHSYASVALLEEIVVPPSQGFSRQGGRWIIFPSLAYRNHLVMEKTLTALAEELSTSPYNRIEGDGKGRLGIACGGVSYSYVKEALAALGREALDCCRLLKIGAFPFPGALGQAFLEGLTEVLVLEELDPVVERELVLLCGLAHLPVRIRGKLSGDLPVAGENTVQGIKEALQAFLPLPLPVPGPGAPPVAALPVTVLEPMGAKPALPPLPVRPPVLCAGCPHRNAFFAVKEVTKGKKAVFSGDIGCYTLGNAAPLEMVDTCLCMGAGITMAQGLHRVEPEGLNIAFIGDSTFFHTGIPGIVNAVYNDADIVVVILDNYTTAMTGSQPHPGTGQRADGQPAARISIYDVVAALGVASLRRAAVFDFIKTKEALAQAMAEQGVRVVLLEGPCIALNKGAGALAVMAERCTGCRQCINKLGCPALSLEKGQAVIDPVLCTGCGLCQNVCPVQAIGAREGGQ